MVFKINSEKHGVTDLELDARTRTRFREELIFEETEITVTAELAHSIVKVPFDPDDTHILQVNDETFAEMEFVGKEARTVTFWKHEKEINGT